MCLVLWILLSKDIVWLYEQPSSSLLWLHPRMEDMIKRFDVFRCFTWMGSYGADSPKGTVLWSNRAGVKKLARCLPENKVWSAEMTTKKANAHGGVSITGGRDLKGSQAYTNDFAMSALSFWLEEHEPKTPALDDVQLPNIWAPLSKKDRWEDADLTDVFQYLSIN